MLLTDPEAKEKSLVCDFFKRKGSGFFVEVGAKDPMSGSQTFLLEQLGWTGILVEPQTELCRRLREKRPKSRVVQAACCGPDKDGAHFGPIEKLRVLTLDEVVKQAGNPKVDFVSIEVGGMELELLRGFDLANARPLLLLIADTVRSLEKHRYLLKQGYKLVKRTGLNNWYVPKESVGPGTTLLEQLDLRRKMYLALPLRNLLHRKRVAHPTSVRPKTD